MKLEELKGKIKFEAVIGLFLLVAVVAGGVLFFAGSSTNDTQLATVSPPISGDVGEDNNTENAPQSSELASIGQGCSYVPIYSVFDPKKPVTPHKPTNPSESDDGNIEIPFDELPDDIKDILFPGWRDDDDQDDEKPHNDTGNQTDDEDDLWDYPEAPEEDLDSDDVEIPEDDDGFPEEGPQEENPDEETPDVPDTPDDIGEVEDVDPTDDEGEFPEDIPDDMPNEDWINDWING